ncbi:MAG: two-component system sensor histidine kinase NtrB [Desulfobulbaceae bacterium]
MRYFPRPRIFYVSPWLLAAATALLVLIVVTFTLNNIRREQQLMTQAMLQKADTLMRIVHSGAKSAYLFDLGRGIWRTDPWHAYVQRMVNHVADEPDVLFLAVVDETGSVIVHNNEERVGGRLTINLPDAAEGMMERAPSTGYRIANEPGTGRQFEAVRAFFPYRPLASPHGQLNKKHGSRQREGLMFSPPDPQGESFAKGDDRHNYYIVVGLDMGRFDQALQRLKLQALVLSVTMLLVGIGGWLSLAAVQGFRVSQRTLTEIKAFTALLVAKLPVGIIATDRSGRVTTWNSAAEEMTGISAGDASGRTPGEVLPSDFSVLFTPDGNGEENAPAAVGREREIVVSVAGRRQYLLCHGMSVLDNQGEYQGQVLLISNLTQLKAMEKEMRENERLAAVGRMAAGVAHEVRNPLSSVKGLALLLKGKFAPESRESETASLLIQEVERMNRTVSELLSFARPAPLHVQDVSLSELLADTLRLIASDTENSGIVTRLQLAGDLLPVAGDPDRLNQVFLNLLLNAVQSMEQGGELTVSAQNSREGGSVLVSIRDNGCGIAQENLSQLFYPYFTTKTGGTGIGLAISQKIISDHKGSIRIDSTPGEGTTVVVELPAYRAQQIADPNRDSARSVSGNSGSGIRIPGA